MSEHSHEPTPPTPAHAGTIPASATGQLGGDRPPIIVAPFYKDPVTGELFLHRDMFRSRGPWEEEAHVGPVKRTDKFGDVESFAAYVKRYGDPEHTFITWNGHGIGAILDFHTKTHAQRAQWSAAYPFKNTDQWATWLEFADGSPASQKAAVEFLEDNASDIREPAAGALMTLLRSLKAWSNANAQATYNEDGTAKVSFAKETGVRNTGSEEMALPSEIKIAIPLIEGHPDVVGLTVRVRASVDENARLAFRFTIPRAEEVLDQLRAELAAKASIALNGDTNAPDYTILRAAD